MGVLSRLGLSRRDYFGLSWVVSDSRRLAERAVFLVDVEADVNATEELILECKELIADRLLDQFASSRVVVLVSEYGLQ